MDEAGTLVLENNFNNNVVMFVAGVDISGGGGATLVAYKILMIGSMASLGNGGPFPPPHGVNSNMSERR